MVYLDVSKKTFYMVYRWFLKALHRYRDMMFYKPFDKKAKNESAPERHKNGHHVFEMVKNIHVIFRKKTMEGKTQGIEVHLQSPVYISRSSPSSSSTCLTGQIWRSPMLSMECSWRRMCLRAWLASCWTHRASLRMAWNLGRTWSGSMWNCSFT